MRLLPLPHPVRLPANLVPVFALALTLLPFTGLPADPASTSAAVDALFASPDRSGAPGAAVVVVREGAVVHSRGYGLADLEHQLPITPQTVFDVASVAKQFTGLAVAMLIQEGKLSLDDEIHKYLPDVPDFGAPIAVRHLLYHTSGLRDWPETLAFSGLSLEGPVTFETILEMVRRQRELDFPPGSEHQYSNTGYNLLAALIAKITEEPFGVWTGRRLFEPLGMAHTRFLVNPASIIPDRAESYEADGPFGFRHVGNRLAAQGSSSLYTTAEDLGRWLINFDAPQPFAGPALDLMHTAGRLDNGKPVGYAAGVGLGEYRGDPRVLHTGGWAAFRSLVMRLPKRRFGVAILGNDARLNVVALGERIADLYVGAQLAPTPPKPAPPATATNVDPARWKDYPGTYALGPDWLLTVSVEAGQLRTRATREAAFPARPLSDTEFQVDAYGASIRFVRDASGAVNELIYRGIHAPRLDPEVTPADTLVPLAGTYWSPELRTVVTLETHEGRLRTWHPMIGWVDLHPLGTDRFGARQAGTIQFTRDAESRVSGLKLSGSRVRNLRFERVNLPR